MLIGQKRTGHASPISGREKRRSVSGQDLVPHYSPDQLKELVKFINPERGFNSAAEAFATLGGPYKEVFTTFCAQSLDFYPEEADKAWDRARAECHTFKSCAEAIRRLLSWALEDNQEPFRKWLLGIIPEVALRKYGEGDRGLAEIAGVLLGDTLKGSVKTGRRVFYLYEDSTTAWTKISDFEVKRLVSHALEGFLLKILDKHVFADGSQRSEGDEEEEEGGDEDQEDTEQKLVKRLIEQVQGSGKMGSILALAQDLFIDEDFVAKLDSVNHLLGVQNGVVDLRSGELRARTPDDMISTILPVQYDPSVEDPWVGETIKGIMADDEETTKYLQKVLGYCITGDVSEDVFVVFTNSGSNGKDVIMGGLQAILGDFYKQMDTDIIIGKGGSRSNTKIKKGVGGRIWSFNETDDNEKFNSSTVKQLSGGNRLTFGMNDVAPHQTCILTTNHVPQLGVVTKAVTRRLLIIKFPVTYRPFADGEVESKYERKIDTTLRSRFLDHGVGFLKWLVDGAVAWYKQKGLKENVPAAVVDSINEYLQSQDLIEQFIAAKCEKGKGFWVLTEDFLNAYNDFFKFEGLSFRAMSRLMDDKPAFCKKQVYSAGSRLGYHGLRLRCLGPQDT